MMIKFMWMLKCCCALQNAADEISPTGDDDHKQELRQKSSTDNAFNRLRKTRHEQF